jgi:outer membrane protein assembly factor BamA
MYFDEGFIYTNIENEFNKVGDLLNVNLVINENTRAKIRQIHLPGIVEPKRRSCAGNWR